MADLENFFLPSSIAIIGASPDRGKIRGRLVARLIESGFKGIIYPVNPNHKEIMGYKTYPSVKDIPDSCDLALVAVPAAVVPDTLRTLIIHNCFQAVIYSSGFAEAGGDYKNLENEIQVLAADNNMTILGPNAVGFLNVAGAVAATFSPGIQVTRTRPTQTHRGTQLVIISQSGGLGFSIYQQAISRSIAVSHVVSTGNEAGLTVLDIVEYALKDETVGCILVYVEQIREISRLRPLAEKALKQGVPIVVVKAGRSEAGRRAAISHTASMVGNDNTHTKVFEHLGIFRVYDQHEMLDLAAAFTTAPLPKNDRVGIVSMSGGGAIWLTDACEDAGLQIPELSTSLQQKLRPLVPHYGGVTNPIDLTANSLENNTRIQAIELLYNSDEVDSIVVVATLSEPGILNKEKLALANLASRMEKPLFFCSYTMPHSENLDILANCGIAVFSSFTGCARALNCLTEYATIKGI